VQLKGFRFVIQFFSVVWMSQGPAQILCLVFGAWRGRTVKMGSHFHLVSRLGWWKLNTYLHLPRIRKDLVLT
jgi:hypothetical protein